jgi:hypothetical protein
MLEIKKGDLVRRVNASTNQRKKDEAFNKGSAVPNVGLVMKVSPKEDMCAVMFAGSTELVVLPLNESYLEIVHHVKK